MDIEKEARTWIKDNYPLMNADDFNDCEELDVYDMISFAKHIQSKLEQRVKACTHETLVIDHLRSKATEAYLNYIRCHEEQECLGFEAKIASGEFGTNELESHKKAQEWYGKHCAYSDAIRIINDIGL